MSQAYLDSISHRGIKPGLGRMRKLAAILGHPERDFRSIHVTGTNGKGSVCSLLESILIASGIKTGLYTSPHLVHVRERIRVQGKIISSHSLNRCLERIRSQSGGLEKNLTAFEILTAAAMCHFSEKKVEIAILEVGLGGRWDATNIIPAPELCILTNVALEHTHFLGDTTEKIAWEKAGIVKEGCFCLTAASGSALKAAQTVCKEKNAVLVPIQKQSVRDSWLRMCSLKGDFQRENVGVVLNAVEILRKKGWNIPPDSIRNGLAKARWPCRFDWRYLRRGRKRTPVLLDGAHNPAAMEACVRSVCKTPLGESKVLLMFNALRDKDISAMVKILCDNLNIRRIFIPVLPTDRTSSPETVRKIILKQGNKNLIPIECFSSVREAWKELKTRKEIGAQWIFVVGSLYLAGESLKKIREKKIRGHHT